MTPSRSAIALFAVSLVAAVAPVGWSQPTLTINGTTAASNSAVAHATKYTPLTIELTGTPGAPFALLMSADAFDGAQVGEPTISSGFYLKPWVLAPVIDSPIHPVFDGIGMEYIRTKLNSQGDATLAADDVLADTPSPVFRFDAQGKFTLAAVTPAVAFLRNLTPVPPNFPDPLVLALESSPGQSISLFLQVVELDIPTLGITSGNGMKLVFDAVNFSATIGYSEGTDPSPSTVVVANRQTLGTIFDGNLTDGTAFAPVTAPDFSGSAVGNLDLWRITLAGVHPLARQSLSPVGSNGLTTQTDVDATTSISLQHQYASGIDFLAGDRPQFANENIEFGAITLPGDRQLFHWRNDSTVPSGPTYGFGVYFRQTGEFKLVSPALLGGLTRSCWEVEVGVSPDGNRALAVHDDLSGGIDHVYMLNLESGASGLFQNGLSYHDITPTLPSLSLYFSRVYEESITFTTDGADNWVAFFCSTSDTSGNLAVYPNRMWRVWMKDSGPTVSPTTALQVLPGPPPLNVFTRIDRQPIVSDDHRMVAVSAGPNDSDEDILLFSQITSFSQSLDDLTKFPNPTKIHETNDAYDGESGTMTFSPDGQWVGFVRFTGSMQVPVVARTDVSTAGAVVDLIGDINTGGQFDGTDFAQCRDVVFAEDNSHLLFLQGVIISNAQADRFDLFSVNLNSGQVVNRTATLNSETKIFGPYVAPSNTFDRSTLDPAGMFRSPNGDFLYVVRDARGLFQVGADRMNLIALSIASPGPGQDATLDIVNVTGQEFAAQPGGTLPGPGTPDVIGDGSANTEGTVGAYYSMRRIGGSGPFKDYACFRARVVGSESIDQLFLIDLNNPGPALQLTDFNTTGGQIQVSSFASITSITPSKDEPKIAFILDKDGLSNPVGQQDLILLDLGAFGALKRVPDTAPPFTRLITAGTLRFTDAGPSGLFYASGSIPRGAGNIDGVLESSDPTNPIDATAYFHRFDQAGSLHEIAPSAGGARRAVFIYGAAAQ